MSDAQAHGEDLDPDPYTEFQKWFAIATRAGIPMPEAAAVATATPDGRPSCRMVLIKGVDPGGFVFFTNYDSRKGIELAANPQAALLFHWPTLERQVRIEGPVQPTSRQESIDYAHTRSRESQLSALASEQSRPVDSRAELEQRVAGLAREFAEQPLPVPESWGGLRLAPERFEFWIGGPNRLHDRFLYTGAPTGGWMIERLQP
jgi:pyridoxamine 5'-phosphate oxidase